MSEHFEPCPRCGGFGYLLCGEKEEIDKLERPDPEQRALELLLAEYPPVQADQIRRGIIKPHSTSWDTALRALTSLQERIRKLEDALRRVLAIPAVNHIVGSKHTPDCDCSVCRARALLSGAGE